MPRDRPLLFYNWIIIGAKFVEKVTEQRKRASGARTATFSNCLDIRDRTRSLAQLTVRARAYFLQIDCNQQPKLEPKMDLIGVYGPRAAPAGLRLPTGRSLARAAALTPDASETASAGGSQISSEFLLRGTKFLPTARYFSPSLASLTEGGNEGGDSAVSKIIQLKQSVSKEIWMPREDSNLNRRNQNP